MLQISRSYDLHTLTVHRSRVDPPPPGRQGKVPRADVVLVTIQRENIRPSKKEVNKSVTMLKLPDVFS
jgi:hypothetical protein